MITVILPTYEEAENLGRLLPELLSALDHATIESEVLVVDDASTDGSAEVAERLLGPRGRVIRRTGRPGLARAALEGIRAARGDVIVLMDADLEHPVDRVVPLARAVLDAQADVAVGSRFAPGGGILGRSAWRRACSHLGAWLARGPARGVLDPLSGLLAFRRSVVEGVDLGTRGFKIGLEVLARGRYGKAVEIPYVHGTRISGLSKFGVRASLAFLVQLATLRFARRTESA